MNYALGAKSLRNLAGVHPDLVRAVERAIQITSQDFTVFEGLRTPERQEEYLRRGVTRTRNSKHLRQPDGYGHAADLVPIIAGVPRWEWGAIWPIAAAMQQAARELSTPVTWGGVWDRSLAALETGAEGLRSSVAAYQTRHPGPDFLDGPHYQLA